MSKFPNTHAHHSKVIDGYIKLRRTPQTEYTVHSQLTCDLLPPRSFSTTSLHTSLGFQTSIDLLREFLQPSIARLHQGRAGNAASLRAKQVQFAAGSTALGSGPWKLREQSLWTHRTKYLSAIRNHKNYWMCLEFDVPCLSRPTAYW